MYERKNMIMFQKNIQAWRDLAAASEDLVNPLNRVRLGFHEAKDSRAIAKMIINPNKEKDRWDRAAITLMIGAILHVKYSSDDQSIKGLRRFLSRPRKNVLKVVDAMLTTEHDSEGKYNWMDPVTGRPSKTHPIVASIARELAKNHSEELSDIIDVAIIKLKVWPEKASCSEVFKEIRHG
jgi:type IV secretion system protein VirD4